MKDTLKEYIKNIGRGRQKRRRVTGALLVLSLFVAGGVSWQLRLTGITLSNDACCGQEEHHHTEACGMTRVLVCGYPEVDEADEESATATHIHGDGCYEEKTVWLCGLEEGQKVTVHTHDKNCYELQSVLKCGLKEHTHSVENGCYKKQKVLTCKENHNHTEECYTEELVLTCDIPEHTHSETCRAEENVLVCKEPETVSHHHTKECGQETQRVLICGLEKGETAAVPHHVHTEACYKNVYQCGLEEHAHTLACYSNPDADLETGETWESTIPAELTGRYAEDLIAVAQSQLYYHESTNNFRVAKDGETMQGYTRYGAWYGNPYGDWNAMFASFCLRYAGISREVVPYHSGCYAWAAELEQRDLLLGAESHVPVPGDLVFFDRDKNGKADDVAILIRTEEDGQQLSLTAVEGDREDRVDKFSFRSDDSEIYGYVNIAGQQLAEEPETTLTAVIYTDGTYKVLAEDVETTITVTGVLPKDAQVKAYPITADIRDRQVLSAYDITIYLADGTVYEPEKTLNVHFTLPNMEDYSEGVFSVLHVDDAGKTEMVASRQEEDGVSFEADRFSGYAVLYSELITTIDNLNTALADPNTIVPIAIGNIDINENVTIDLKGHTIDASGGGFTVKDGGSLTVTDSVGAVDTPDAGVPTFATNAGKLAELKDDTLTYYVTETSVVNKAVGETEETLVTHTVTLRGKITGGGVTVESGGSFTMSGGAICGTTDYAVNSTGGTVTMDGGYICGNAGGIKAVGGTVTMNGGVIAGNRADKGGGIHVEKHGTLQFNNGIISGNDGYGGGGGIYADHSNVELHHGYITNNLGDVDEAENGGGGIMCDSGCTLTVGDGILNELYITANKAGSGGGIVTCNMYQRGDGSNVVMNSGFVTGNLANKTEGGGMAIRALSTATITGGYITNNVKSTTESWGGGGIFGQEFSEITMTHALITENSAGVFGGGVTGCSTGTVLIQDTEGAAVYGNSADGSEDNMAVSNKGEDREALADTVFMQGGTYQDYYCALVSMVKGVMLGGGSENWYGSADGERVFTDSADDVLTASIRMGLNAKPSEEGIQKAQELAHLFINGNSSATHGGGVLANGVLILGNNDKIFELPGTLTVNAKKALNGEFGEGALADYRFGFKLMDENKEEICTAYNDADGLITFPKIEYTKAGTFTYYMEELFPEYPSITLDTTVWKLEVTVEKQEVTPEKGSGNPAYSVYRPTKCYIYCNDKLLNEWQAAETVKPDEWVAIGNEGNEVRHTSQKDFHVNLFGFTSGEQNYLYTFNNTFADKVTIEVSKEWEGEDGEPTEEHPESVTVYLTKNGVRYESDEDAYKSPVVLDASNNWSYKWSDLPGKGGDVPIIWGIEEDVPDGWEPHLSYGKSRAVDPEPSGPEPVLNPVEGTEYYIGTADYGHVITFSGTGGEWNTGISYEQPESIVNNPRFVVNPSADGKFTFANADSKYSGVSFLVKYNEWSPEFLTFSPSNVSTFRIDDGYLMVDVLKDDGTIAYSKYLTYTSIDGNMKAGVSDEPDLNNTFCLYTIPDKPGGGTGGNTNSSAVTITNRPKSQEQFYGFTVKKVNVDNVNEVLPGAHFRLIRTDDNEVMTFTQDPNTDVYYFDGHPNQIYTLVVGEDGTFRVEGLAAGEYILEEIKAPDGYTIPAGEEAKTHITLPSEEADSVVTITNGQQPAYELPETGGRGTIPYMVGGLLMMAAPLMFRARRRRHEGRAAR